MNKFIRALPDVMAVAGACLISVGAWLLHPAAGCVTGGVLLLAGAAVVTRNAANVKAEG